MIDFALLIHTDSLYVAGCNWRNLDLIKLVSEFLTFQSHLVFLPPPMKTTHCASKWPFYLKKYKWITVLQIGIVRN